MKKYFPINKFGNGKFESLSGVGSSLENTDTIRMEILKLLIKLNINHIDDCPCGDFNWMRYLVQTYREQNKMFSYRGIDIQPDLISLNKKYISNKVDFIFGDVRNFSFYNYGLILIRDCFIHLPNELVLDSLINIKNKSNESWLLTTTYPSREKNTDIKVGNFRPINLELPPFNIGKPVKYINENYPHINYWDKCLGLWKVSDIKVGSL